MKVYQTPPYRFSDLKDFPFKPHFISVNGLQMHYVDEGPVGGRPVLLLHGVPTWSYLYRKIISKIASEGIRVIAPDLIGFGKSDKPANKSDHSYKAHIEWVSIFISSLHLKKIILFGHDWGSLIGLRIAADHPEIFSAIIICNGMLPTGEQKMHFTFKLWKFIAKYSPILPVDTIIQAGTVSRMEKKVRQAYRAPFPSLKYKAGIRSLPGLVPVLPDYPESVANRKAYDKLSKWEKPFLTVFSDMDPITRGGDKYLQRIIPGSVGQDHKIMAGGHFIQEDKSEELADIILEFITKTDSRVFHKDNLTDELEMSD